VEACLLRSPLASLSISVDRNAREVCVKWHFVVIVRLLAGAHQAPVGRSAVPPTQKCESLVVLRRTSFDAVRPSLRLRATQEGRGPTARPNNNAARRSLGCGWDARNSYLESCLVSLYVFIRITASHVSAPFLNDFSHADVCSVRSPNWSITPLQQFELPDQLELLGNLPRTPLTRNCWLGFIFIFTRAADARTHHVPSGGAGAGGGVQRMPPP